jgi:insertion element IS1 protein InsB
MTGGAYSRLIPRSKHIIGKENTQAIERQNLTLRTRIKRLTKRTICFSKSSDIHHKVIGTFIERECFQSF